MKKCVFVHLPKTGGSTIHQAVASNLKPAEVSAMRTGFNILYMPLMQGSALVSENEFLSAIAGRRFISGHFHFSQARLVGKSYRLVTHLRNPLERLCSNYNFI